MADFKLDFSINKNKVEYTNTLKKCIKIAEERGSFYDDAIKNYIGISKLCNEMFGLNMKPSDIIKVMIATKFNREKFRHKEDNLEDSINYIAILNLLINKNL
jgi:hypothetical protein